MGCLPVPPGGHHGAVAPLAGFRFRQVGTGPVEARAGTLLALLGAQVVVVADRDGAAAVPAHGTVDGTGRERRAVARGRGPRR